MSADDAQRFFLKNNGPKNDFWDLDPAWERERERVNRDALTRLKTPRGVGGLTCDSHPFRYI